MNNPIVPPNDRPADCMFCRIVDGDAPAEIVASWDDAIAIVPLDPVTSGHLLVIPRTHVGDARTDPSVTGAVFARAAELAESLPDFNLITNAGAKATQTVWHLHVHVVPRRNCDGLPLPWTPQQIVARNLVGGA